MGQRCKIDDIELDATPEHDYSGDVETTDHPVETSFNPTDHARVKPETWIATCVVSSMPIDQDQQSARGTFKSGSSGGYARGVYARIKQMKDDRNTHTVTTPEETYENMVITALSRPFRAQYGDGVMFKISLKQVRIVNSSTGQFVTAGPKTSTLKPTTKVNQSKKVGTEAPEDRSGLDAGLIAVGALKKD